MLKQSHILDCFDPAEFEFAAVNGMRIAARRKNDRPVGDYVADLSAIPKRLVVGAGAPAWLAEYGIDAPSGLLQYRIIEGGATVVRLHHQQYLLIEDMSASPPGPVFDLDEGRHGKVLVLDYECADFAIGGPHTTGLLAELCPMDIAAAPDGIWIAARMAHCEVSLQLVFCPANKDTMPAGCRFFCSPADGRFLFGIIRDVMDQHAGAVLGFHDYLRIRERERL